MSEEPEYADEFPCGQCKTGTVLYQKNGWSCEDCDKWLCEACCTELDNEDADIGIFYCQTCTDAKKKKTDQVTRD